MGVSSSGVSVGKPSIPQMDPNMLLAVALDPKKTSERLAALMKAEASYARIVAAHGKVAEIDGLLEDAKKSQTEARSKITSANTRAKKIGAEAEERAKATATNAMAVVNEEKTALRRTRERLTKQKNDLDLRENRFAPLEAELLGKQASLEKEIERTRAVRADLDGRIAVMEKALKEVKI